MRDLWLKLTQALDHLAEHLLLVVVGGVLGVDHERVLCRHHALHQHCHAHVVKVQADLWWSQRESVGRAQGCEGGAHSPLGVSLTRGVCVCLGHNGLHWSRHLLLPPAECRAAVLSCTQNMGPKGPQRCTTTAHIDMEQRQCAPCA